MTDLVLALDFGGTKLSAAVAAHGARAWLALERTPSPARPDAAYDQATILAMARRLLDGRTPAAVGVSFGGPVDYRSGMVRLSHHVAGWEQVPLKARLEAELGAPAWVDNDANVAALGEHRFGAGRGCASLMYVTVSTGVGGGWILNGAPWRGHAGMAGEIGHTVVDPQGPACLCGKRGCVERLASGPYLAGLARERLRAEPGSGPVVRRLAGGALEAVDARLLAEAAGQGDELAWEVLATGARALGAGLGNAANLINPERFVLGGGVTKSGPRYWDEVRAAARAMALPEVRFDIVPADLGDDAPLWGAVALTELRD